MREHSGHALRIGGIVTGAVPAIAKIAIVLSLFNRMSCSERASSAMQICSSAMRPDSELPPASVQSLSFSSRVLPASSDFLLESSLFVEKERLSMQAIAAGRHDGLSHLFQEG
ncbi:hypothetical protein BLNAU_14414 [Blattamonas nauphoetae]|uniref:Uncharacterized protein n=1 Tax=Blattamonas nauphoetae TaxID=2049346 RepID=A0ABQ9XDP7_9EUKA|nr:hypothetical protein BLNAU_14414 [Blattamonas nauphoetae]